MMLNDIELKINQIEDIRELNQISQFIKQRRKALGCRLKYSLNVGETVNVNGTNGTERGIVDKINRTRAIVSISNGYKTQKWNVPFSMIAKIGDDNE